MDEGDVGGWSKYAYYVLKELEQNRGFFSILNDKHGILKDDLRVGLAEEIEKRETLRREFENLKGKLTAYAIVASIVVSASVTLIIRIWGK